MIVHAQESPHLHHSTSFVVICIHKYLPFPSRLTSLKCHTLVITWKSGHEMMSVYKQLNTIQY